MLYLKQVQKAQEQTLSHLMEKYLYEMTRYYDIPMDEEGNFGYKYLPYYFTESQRAAYFICEDTVLIGFVLINTHSWTDEKIDNSIAEFTIFPAYRRNGNGMKAVDALVRTRPGNWQLKYSTANLAGQAFWTRVKEKYHGRLTVLEDSEIAITFGEKATDQ